MGPSSSGGMWAATSQRRPRPAGRAPQRGEAGLGVGVTADQHGRTRPNVDDRCPPGLAHHADSVRDLLDQRAEPLHAHDGDGVAAAVQFRCQQCLLPLGAAVDQSVGGDHDRRAALAGIRIADRAALGPAQPLQHLGGGQVRVRVMHAALMLEQ